MVCPLPEQLVPSRIQCWPRSFKRLKTIAFCLIFLKIESEIRDALALSLEGTSSYAYVWGEGISLHPDLCVKP